MMRVEVMAIVPGDKQILWNELQDYIAGMTAFVEIAPVNGEFEYPGIESYWRMADRWPYWAMVDGARAGFAFVRRNEDGAYVMAEFYVRPEFRRTGVGLSFASQLLERFPGTWILSEFRENEGAVAFWRRAIRGFSFTERAYVGGQGKDRLEQRVIVT